MSKQSGTLKLELGSAMSPGNIFSLASKRKERKGVASDVAAFLKAGGKIKRI